MNLLDAAKAYRELMNYRYTFLLGHKGKAEMMMLEFTKEAFHHLAGLHKKDLERVKNKKYALDYILVDGIIPQADFSYEIQDRWNCICSLKAMIESNSLIFRLRNRELPGSNIRADYLLTDDFHLFFVDQSQPVSIFTAREDQLRNAARCLRLTTLKITREDIFTGSIETIFVSDSYKETETRKS